MRKRRSKTVGLSEQLRHLAQVLEAYEEGVALFEASAPNWHMLFVNEALLTLTGIFSRSSADCPVGPQIALPQAVMMVANMR